MLYSYMAVCETFCSRYNFKDEK